MAAAFADRIPIILRDFHASIKRVCVESERFMHVVPSHASCVPVLTRDILRASWMQPLQNRLPCFKWSSYVPRHVCMTLLRANCFIYIPCFAISNFLFVTTWKLDFAISSLYNESFRSLAISSRLKQPSSTDIS